MLTKFISKIISVITVAVIVIVVIVIGIIKKKRLLTNLRKNWDLHEKQKVKEWEANNDLLRKKITEYKQKLIRMEVTIDLSPNF